MALPRRRRWGLFRSALGPNLSSLRAGRRRCARWARRCLPRQAVPAAAWPSFRLLAGPPLELSKLGALGCWDRGCAGETPTHVRGGRARRGPAPGGSRTSAAPAAAPFTPPARGPRRRRPCPPCSAPPSPRAPFPDGEAAAARAVGQALVRRCAPEAAFPGRAMNLCGSLGWRRHSAFFFLFSTQEDGAGSWRERGRVKGTHLENTAGAPPGSSG